MLQDLVKTFRKVQEFLGYRDGSRDSPGISRIKTFDRSARPHAGLHRLLPATSRLHHPFQEAVNHGLALPVGQFVRWEPANTLQNRQLP